ncbi:MAG: hypothetical protein K2G31_03580, partial [Clostridia bacterium]|nr:hypothetical protein [Clostridia bacterium]
MIEAQPAPADLMAEAVSEKRIRLSGVELLRILAILLICVHHAVTGSEGFIDFDGTLSVGTVFLRLLRYCGQIGNIIFVICSAYFLTDSK